jgi:hypothetical protein
MTTRRSLLATGVAVGVGFAGCAEQGERTPDGGPATDGNASIAEVSLESGDGSCGSDAGAEIIQTEDGIEATGQVVTPTPCYLATLEDYGARDGSATFQVGVEEDPDAEACMECIGTVPFDLSARLGDGIETVVVELGGNEPETVRKQLS